MVVIPAGKKVRFLITANDVIHSWWVPAFAIKQDAIPGYSTLTGSIVFGPTNNVTLPHLMSGNSWTLHSSGSYATVNFGHTPTPGFDMSFRLYLA